MVDTKAVSIRLPLDLLNELNSYATDKGMVRSGDANIGRAIISILRERFFNESDNVKQVSDNVDFEAMIAAAIDSKLSGFKASVNDEFLDMKQAIAPLLARLESLESDRSEATAPANFTTALIQKAKVLAHQKMKELPQAG